MKRPALIPEEVDTSHLTDDQRRDRDAVIRTGRLGFGERWQSPLGAALSEAAGRRYGPQQINHWIAGTRPVPDAVAAALRTVGPQVASELERRAAELRELWKAED
jgi:hypothetical protein